MADEGAIPLADDPPPPAPPWPDVVPDGPTCRRCGYELRGLPMRGQCPECALPVARSLRGNLLEYSDPAYVGRLATGAMVVEIAIVALCLVPIVGLLVLFIDESGAAPGRTVAGVFRPVGAAVSIAAAMAALVGMFVLTSRDPGLVGADESDRARRVTRWATVVCAVGWACASVISTLPTLAAVAPARFVVLLWLGSTGASIALWVQVIASLLYLRDLAARIPHERLRAEITETRTLAVATPVCLLATFGLALLSMGCLILAMGLVSLVLLLMLVVRYVSVIDSVRRRLRSIERAHATRSG